MSTGIRRIRSESMDQRRGLSNDNVTTPLSHARPYDVDEVTSLDRHRRLFSMEQELQRARQEQAEARQHFEGVIRELLERQRGLDAQLTQQRLESQRLRNLLSAREESEGLSRPPRPDKTVSMPTPHVKRVEEEGPMDDNHNEIKDTHGVVGTAAVLVHEEEEEEAQAELAVALEKLALADQYIRLLSDEAAAQQVEMEQLRLQLEATKNPSADRAQEKAQSAAWALVMDLVLSCADACDAVSRECEELIDVVREQQPSPTAPARPVTSCKPTERELATLLAPANSSWGTGAARVAAHVLRSVTGALHAARDDALIAARAYAELAASRRAALSALEERADAESVALAARRETAEALAARQEAESVALAARREAAEALAARREAESVALAARRAAGETEALAAELREAEARRAEAEAARRAAEGDALFLRKAHADGEAHLARVRRELEARRAEAAAADWERRQAVLRLDSARRAGNGVDLHTRTANGETSASHIVTSLTQSPPMGKGVTNSTAASPALDGTGMDKVRWWEERLAAITAKARLDDPHLERETFTSEMRNEGDFGESERRSAALAALAYGSPAQTPERLDQLKL